MLFNKNNQGIAELKAHLGFLFASNHFANIQTELTLAQEQLAKITGTAVMDAAQTHYASNSYQKPEPTADEAKLDALVAHLQLPIALQGYLDYAPSADLIHDNIGRRAAYEENTQIAREWQIDRSEASLTNRLHQSIDRLLEWLDSSTLTSWTNSTNYTQARALFLNNAQAFQKFHPIDHSRRFYIMAMPFINFAENVDVRPALGQAEYTRLKGLWQANTATGTDLTLIEAYIQPALAALAMMQALRKLPVKALPQGIIQAYTSDRQTTKSSQPATLFDRLGAAQEMQKEANAHLLRLHEYIRQQNLIATPEEPKTLDINQKFFRV
jgi:hypothetical protein